jgi:5-(carboxyamino)imidazole ribonucleotide synthase
MTPSRPRVAVVGGGQLGRMLGLAGIPLRCEFRFLDPAGPQAPAAAVGRALRGPLDDLDALITLAEGADVLTFEFENLPANLVQILEERRIPLAPSSKVLAIAQDRWEEKQFFERLRIPTAPTLPARTLGEVTQACSEIGYPCVIKTRREGYDGKGQAVVRSPDQVEAAWMAVGGGASALVVEGWMSFDEEFSIVAARRRGGEIVLWPACRNTHEGGILRVTRVVPDPSLSPQQRIAHARATSTVRVILNELDYVGVLAVEFFRVGEEVIANEMAPRVHNSGHWTQDAAATSQFENHVRAVLDLPLGPPDLRVGAEGAIAMVNYIGTLPATADALSGPAFGGGTPEFDRDLPPVYRRLHLYDKAPRPGRKLGHLNLWSESRRALEKALQTQAAQRP